MPFKEFKRIGVRRAPSIRKWLVGNLVLLLRAILAHYAGDAKQDQFLPAPSAPCTPLMAAQEITTMILAYAVLVDQRMEAAGG